MLATVVKMEMDLVFDGKGNRVKDVVSISLHE